MCKRFSRIYAKKENDGQQSMFIFSFPRFYQLFPKLVVSIYIQNSRTREFLLHRILGLANILVFAGLTSMTVASCI